MKLIISQPQEAISFYVAGKVGLPANSWSYYNALGLVDNGILKAGVIYSHWSPYDVMTTIAVERGARITPEYLFAIHNYPFVQVGVRRLNAVIKFDNAPSIKFVENLGFVLEGRVRKAFGEDEGLLYGMLKEECRWISPEFQSLLQRRHLRRTPAVNQIAA